MLDDAVVAVTGATGFLGRAVTERLVAGGARVRILARTPARAARLPAGVDVRWGDITDPPSLRRFVAGADIVIHAAAAMGGPLPHQLAVNRDGTAAVARAAAVAGVRRLVHVSTIAVYGFAGVDFPEDRPLQPSPQSYSQSKAAAEEALVAAGVPHAIIRPAGIFGPGARFWTQAYARRARRRPILFVGDGNGTLPVVFVDDVADLILTLAGHDAAPGEAFNACLDPAPTVKEYHHAYGRLFGNETWLGAPLPLVKAAARFARPFAKPHTYLSDAPAMLDYLARRKRYPIDKAARLVGWRPAYDVERGVAACVPWLRRQGILGRDARRTDSTP